MNYTITDTPWTPKETGDWKRPEVCEHCGESKGMHYQHADGRIVCVRFSEPESAGHPGAPHE